MKARHSIGKRLCIRVAVVMSLAIAGAIAAGSARATVWSQAPAGGQVALGAADCTGSDPNAYANVSTPDASVTFPPGYPAYSQWVAMDTGVMSSSDGIHWSQPTWYPSWENSPAGPYYPMFLPGQEFYVHQLGLYWRTLTYIQFYVGPKYSRSSSTLVGTYYAQDDDQAYQTWDGNAKSVWTATGWACYVR